jgi:hypothetical protein
MANISKSPFTALVEPAVVQAAAERAERLDLPRRTSKAWTSHGHDASEDDDDDSDMDLNLR